MRTVIADKGKNSALMMMSFTKLLDVFVHEFTMEFRSNRVIDETSILQKRGNFLTNIYATGFNTFLGSALAQFLNTTSSSHLERKGISKRRGKTTTTKN